MRPKDEEDRPKPETGPPPEEVFPDYDTTESGTEGWWSRVFSLRMALALGVLVLVAVGLWLSPRLYDRFKEHRAMRFVKEAHEAEAQGDFASAFASYRQAFLIAPESMKVRRQGTRFSAGLGEPVALREVEARVASGDATATEILAVAKGRLATGDLKGAAEAAARLEQEELSEDLAFQKRKLQLQISAASGHLPEALEELSALIAAAPPERADEWRLLAAGLILGAAREGQSMPSAKQARDFLLAMEGRESRMSLEALRLLARLDLAGVFVPDREKMIAALTTHPLHEQADVLLAAEVELMYLLADRQDVIDRIKRTYREGSKPERLAAAKWLQQQQAREDALEFLGESAAVSDSDLFLVYGDALSGLGRWDELARLLKGQSIPGLDEAIRHLFLMRAALESKDAPEVEAQWREVSRHLRLADPRTILYVAHYAERIGATAEAARAFQLLASRPEAPLEGLIGYLKYVPSHAPARELLAPYQRILALKPDFPEAQNDYAYLRLLLEQDVGEILPKARERFERSDPKPLAFLTTLALAELRSGDAAAAADLYRKHGVDAASGTPAQRAVRARVLWESGEQEPGRELASTINRSELRPSERKLIEPL